MTHFTQVPNTLFDEIMSELTGAELKLLLLVFRQTWGWVNAQGKRKVRDWMACSQIQKRTGLSRRAISLATSSLIERGLLVVSDAFGGTLQKAEQRKGKVKLYYSVSWPVENHPPNRTPCAKSAEHLRTYYPQQKQLLQKKRAFKGKPDQQWSGKRHRYIGSIDGVIREGIHPSIIKRILED